MSTWMTTIMIPILQRLLQLQLRLLLLLLLPRILQLAPPPPLRTIGVPVTIEMGYIYSNHTPVRFVACNGRVVVTRIVLALALVISFRHRMMVPSACWMFNRNNSSKSWPRTIIKRSIEVDPDMVWNKNMGTNFGPSISVSIHDTMNRIASLYRHRLVRRCILIYVVKIR